MKSLKSVCLILLVVLFSGDYAFADKEKKEEMKGMMHPGMMGGMMMENKEEHHRMMNDMMMAVADLAAVVKGSVADKAAKDKCDAIIARVGELIKKHDEMMKSHQERMEEMMKSHKERMEKEKKK